MSQPAVSVESLGKSYRIGAAGVDRTLVDTFGNWLSGQARRVRGIGVAHGPTQPFWALRDLSFKILPGEIVGIIGHNGAGKSTLLKLLSRITEPTEGRLRYRGRVGSLLEIGTGFHPELTGRDNIFLSGAVLGMRHREIRSKLDEIVDFSGVEKFIDTPVKRYSSGMYLRLAFAVAAHLEADILLLDEVLAVGDVAFQKKCLDRMEGVARQGRTVLFVSHNLTAVRSLCSRAILLERGKLAADGPVNETVERYVRSALTSEGRGRVRAWSGDTTTMDQTIQMLRASVRPTHGDVADAIDVSTGFVVEWDYCVGAGQSVTPQMILHDERGLLIFSEGSWDIPRPLTAGKHRTICLVPGNLLNDGGYFVSLQFQTGDGTTVELPNVLHVELLDNDEGRHGWYGKWDGVLRVKLEWQTERIDGETPLQRESTPR
jgi:lipopolysaccharide transport system ATP-binding protein